MMIQLDEGALKKRTTAGPELYYASAKPSEKKDIKAVLGMVPGYADHGARYAHVMGAFAEHGIGTTIIDLRGHGRALGTRGFCSRFDEFIDDVSELRRLVDTHNKDVPAFLFGHSFGGLVAATSVLGSPSGWKGLLLSAPFFGLALAVPRVKIMAGKIASRVLPKLAIPSGLSGKDMTHDAAKAKGYDTDPLVFKKATARWFTETQAAQESAIARAGKLELPLYVTFGTADPVSSMTAAKRFFDVAGSADKTWDPRDGLFHEVLNEPSWKDIVDAMAKWILSRV
jgi:alpha-beta hydrolase superfamily lysophospholipase